MLKTVLVPIAREGRPFIAIFAVAALLMAWIADWLIVPGLILTTWCIYFFRDPERTTPVRNGLIVSPADGVVVSAGPAAWPKELEGGPDGEVHRVCVFMNVFDVHVNRVPVDGAISKLAYVPGAFVNASLDKASEKNERQLVGMTTTDGRPLAFVQIAGLIARRIVCKIEEGQEMLAGQRMGLIRFGSRVDVYLPPGIIPLVAVGQRCVAGETVIADISAQETAREGAVR